MSQTVNHQAPDTAAELTAPPFDLHHRRASRLDWRWLEPHLSMREAATPTALAMLARGNDGCWQPIVMMRNPGARPWPVYFGPPVTTRIGAELWVEHGIATGDFSGAQRFDQDGLAKPKPNPALALGSTPLERLYAVAKQAGATVTTRDLSFASSAELPAAALVGYGEHIVLSDRLADDDARADALAMALAVGARMVSSIDDAERHSIVTPEGWVIVTTEPDPKPGIVGWNATKIARRVGREVSSAALAWWIPAFLPGAVTS